VPFCHLSFCEQLLIWAVRIWAEADQTNGDARTTLQTAFRLAKAPAAYDSLDGLLSVLAVSMTRPIEIHGVHAADISRDEAHLLTIVAALQHGATGKGEAVVLLGRWMAPTGRRTGLEHCTRLARALAAAGHAVQRRDPTTPAARLPAGRQPHLMTMQALNERPC